MNTRFAPSPTGDMHIGNLRAAIMPYLYAKKSGCKFILRIDDTDRERSKDYYIDGIYEDLQWLGITWDYSFKQSDQIERYKKALEFCIEHNLVYEVYDNEEELEELRRKLCSVKKPPAYKHVHAKVIPGREPYWRFDLGSSEVVFDDIIKGKIKTALNTVSDPVICKPNGDFTYTFTSIVDDIHEEISCIIRAVDHLTNTAVQLKMLQSMVEAGFAGSKGSRDLQVAHYPLFCGKGGEKFSKRASNFSLTQLKDTTHPLTLFHYITFLGGKKKSKYCGLDELIQEFDLKNYASSNLIEFNLDEVNKWQGKVMMNLPYSQVREWCDGGLTEAQWKVVRDSVKTKADIMSWKSIFQDKRGFIIDSYYVFEPEKMRKNMSEWLWKDMVGMPDDWKDSLLKAAIDPANSFVNSKSKDPAILRMIEWFSCEITPELSRIVLRKTLTNAFHGPNFDDLMDVMDKDIIEFRLKNLKNECDVPVRVYNTIYGEKEQFRSDTIIKIYACGPTVYDLPHIGNLRSFIVFDILCRMLQEFCPKVIYVRNITDIDDKIITRAEELGIPWQKLTEQVYAQFSKEMELLNVLPPTHEPKVSDNISEIIKMIQEIIHTGVGYVNDNGVCFSIQKYQENNNNYQREMVDVGLYVNDKGDLIPLREPKGNTHEYDVFGCLKNHTGCEQDDFALWKFRKEDEIGWESPWGWGRPGWHIECSAMARKLLGDSFDIHCGGKDLIFPHHANEIAQSQACSEKQMARYWLHNNFVNINSEKMSKSLGNMLRLEDIDAHPMIVRLSLLMAHYRSELNWSDELICEAGALYNKWRRNIGKFLQRNPEFVLSNGFVVDDFIQTLADDLNTPAAIRVLDKLTYELNENNVSDIIKSFGVLGIKFDFDYLYSREIKDLVQKRQEFRKAKNFAAADEVRDKLSEMKVELEESKDETFYYIPY